MPLDDGLYAGAKTYTAYDQYLNDTGALFKLNPSVSLGYAINVALYPQAKDDPNLIPYTSFESASTEAIDQFEIDGAAAIVDFNADGASAIVDFNADGVSAISDFNSDGASAINVFNDNGQDAIDNLIFSTGFKNVGVFGIGETVQNAQETLTYNGEEFNTTAGPFPYVTDGATPAADSADWYNVTLEARKTVARSLNVTDNSVIYDTDTVTAIPAYIYSASQQKTYSVPSGAIGELIVSVIGDQLVTNIDSYTLTIFTTRNYNINPRDFGAIGDGATDDSVPVQSAISTGKEVSFDAGTYLLTGDFDFTDFVSFSINTRFTGAFKASFIGEQSVNSKLWSLT